MLDISKYYLYLYNYRENVGCANSNRLTCNDSIIFNISNNSVQLHYLTSKAIRGISMLLLLIIRILQLLLKTSLNAQTIHDKN